MRQMLLSTELRATLVHGGEHSVGKRKTARPIVTKRPMHLVMRSTQARGEKSFLNRRHVNVVRQLVWNLARQNGVRIYEYANSGNHLHLLLRARTRGGFKKFLRVLAGAIAMKVGGARKGCALAQSFWDLPAFTRIVEWGRAFVVARGYVVQNTLEALGLIGYAPRGVRASGGKAKRSLIRPTRGPKPSISERG